MFSRPNARTAAAAAIAAAGLALAAPSSAEIVFGVTLQDTLVTWDSASPGVLLTGTPIQGLQPNEVIRGIDFRPATGELYALGSFSRLYRVNTVSGVATQVGAQFSTALNGSQFGFDFNPTIDRIRVVSNADQNLVLNPITGEVQLVATTLAYPAGDPNAGRDPDVVHSAYTNSFPGATTTQLYGLDTGLDILVTQANNAGTLGTVGPVNADITSTGGFDISGATGIAYAAVMDVNLARSTFWTINLATGAGTMVGEIDGGVVITAMAVAPVIPAPAASAILGLAGFAVLRRRR